MNKKKVNLEYGRVNPIGTISDQVTHLVLETNSDQEPIVIR